jgi:hypothetical protein
VTGVDWSPCDHSIIYAVDDKGSMSVWNVVKNSLRSMNFGKISPTCVRASPHEKNIVCFGTKGGNIFVVDVTGNIFSIMHITFSYILFVFDNRHDRKNSCKGSS